MSSIRIRDGSEGRGMEGKYRDNWCRVFEAGCPFCHQPVLKTFTGPHPFFNHLQTP